MLPKKIRDEVVFVTNGRFEAESVKALLESFSIPAFINQESAGIAIGLTVGLLGEAEVVVPPAYVEEAKKIIAEMNEGNLEFEEDEENKALDL